MMKIETDTPIEITTLWRDGKFVGYLVEPWYCEQEDENGMIRRDQAKIRLDTIWELTAWLKELEHRHYSKGKDY